METPFTNQQAFALVFFFIVGVAISGPFIAHYWYRTRRAELEAALKRDLLERGMSAAEICAVIEAGECSKPESDREPAAASGCKVNA